MMRNIFGAALLSLGMGISLMASPTTAFAQADAGCNLSCGTDMVCKFVGTEPQCVSVDADINNTVDAITVTAAKPATSGLSLKSLVNDHIIPIGNTILGLLFAFAFLFFIFGVMQYYFLKPGDATARKDGRVFIMWGIISFVVLFSVWGIVNFGINIISSSS